MTAELLSAQVSDDGGDRRRALALCLAIIATLVSGVAICFERSLGCTRAVCSDAVGGPPGAYDGIGTHALHTAGARTSGSAGAGTATISIDVSGSQPKRLAPGVTTPVVVTVRNTGTRPARVTSATIRVRDASVACTASRSVRTTSYVATTRGASKYVVQPHQIVHIPLTISMLDLATNQDRCKSTTFPLAFQATAQQG